MRVLHTSDWHLGKFLENISRIEEQRQFIDELCEIVEREKIDIILIAGDVFDTYNPSAAAEELFYEAVDRLNAKGRRAVLIIAGNHDSPDRLCAASPLAYKNGIFLLGYPSSDAGIFKCESDNIRVTASGEGWLELYIRSCGQSAVILTLPYPSESRLEEVLCKNADEKSLQEVYSDKIKRILRNLSVNFRDDTINLVVSHIYLRDGKLSDSERQLGGAFVVDSDALPPNAQYAALGHLHRPQRIKAAPVPAYYSGSPLAYSFSETDYSKAVFVVDAEPGKTAEVSEIYLKSGKQLKQWKARNGIAEAISWCEDKRDSNCWIDLEIYTDRIITPDEQKQLRDLNPGIINIRPVLLTDNTEKITYQNRESRRIDELFRDYFKQKTGMEAAEEFMDVFLEIINQDDEDLEQVIRGEELETKIS
ncbi:MAG: exonuclease SbcCD subunit D [Bacillota bacterium]